MMVDPKKNKFVHAGRLDKNYKLVQTDILTRLIHK